MQRFLAGLIILVVVPFFAAAAADTPAGGASLQVENGAEVHLEVGVFTLFGDPDFQFAYRPQDSRWIFGYRYSRIEQETDLFGIRADESIRTLQGPNIRYLFDAAGNSRFYAEAGLYRFAYDLDCRIAPGYDRYTRTQLNLGGGILFDIGDSAKINLGVTVSTRGGEPLDAGACRDENGERGDDAVVSIVYFF